MVKFRPCISYFKLLRVFQTANVDHTVMFFVTNHYLGKYDDKAKTLAHEKGLEELEKWYDKLQY